MATTPPGLDLVVAARPNLPKAATLWAALAERPGLCRPRLVHTGQHHDDAMFHDHLADVGLPEPAVRLGVAGGGHAELTGRTMMACEALWVRERPAAVVVVGDVDATLAAALAARKLRLPLVHLEAGLRGADRGMAEEINRRATDAIADLLWPPSASDAATLLREGHPPERVVAVGNAMAACLLARLPLARQRPLPAGLVPGGYGVVTLHRAENVDDRGRLADWLAALAEAAERLPLVWPVHPRTRRRLGEFGLAPPPGLRCLPPQGYLAFLGLLAAARLVATDSGGVQEEATMLDLPCLTLRDDTERPETMASGSNRLVAPAGLGASLDAVLAGGWPRAARPALWDAQVGARMAESLGRFLAALPAV